MISVITVTPVDPGFLYTASNWLIYPGFLALIMAAVEAGYCYGRRAGRSSDESGKAQVSVVEGSLLGVVALLLGFTMSMAVTRFETRKQLVLSEANAIGTAYLRTQLIAPADGTEVAGLLRQYLDVRVQYAQVDEDLGRMEESRRQAQKLQTGFWNAAVRSSLQDPSPVRPSLLLQSLNEVIDLESARWMAFFNHVPAPVIYVDGVVACFAAILMGYASGLNRQRHLFSASMLAFAITLVLAVILDLDRPRRGFIHVSQQPLIDLQHQLRTQVN
jgi:hypothetical protein